MMSHKSMSWGWGHINPYPYCDEKCHFCPLLTNFQFDFQPIVINLVICRNSVQCQITLGKVRSLTSNFLNYSPTKVTGNKKFGANPNPGVAFGHMLQDLQSLGELGCNCPKSSSGSSSPPPRDLGDLCAIVQTPGCPLAPAGTSSTGSAPCSACSAGRQAASRWSTGASANSPAAM